MIVRALWALAVMADVLTGMAWWAWLTAVDPSPLNVTILDDGGANLQVSSMVVNNAHPLQTALGVTGFAICMWVLFLKLRAGGEK